MEKIFRVMIGVDLWMVPAVLLLARSQRRVLGMGSVFLILPNQTGLNDFTAVTNAFCLFGDY